MSVYPSRCSSGRTCVTAGLPTFGQRRAAAAAIAAVAEQARIEGVRLDAALDDGLVDALRWRACGTSAPATAPRRRSRARTIRPLVSRSRRWTTRTRGPKPACPPLPPAGTAGPARAGSAGASRRAWADAAAAGGPVLFLGVPLRGHSGRLLHDHQVPVEVEDLDVLGRTAGRCAARPRPSQRRRLELPAFVEAQVAVDLHVSVFDQAADRRPGLAGQELPQRGNRVRPACSAAT